MGSLASFTIGVIVGIYLDQTHKVPNVEKWIKVGIRKIKDWEDGTRK